MQSPTKYSYNDLKLATKNFSIVNKLGKGGYGDVYKVYVYQDLFICLLMIKLQTGFSACSYFIVLSTGNFKEWGYCCSEKNSIRRQGSRDNI